MNLFVQIAVFNFQYEYAVLQLLLEQADVRFYFLNETALSVMPFYAHALGGIILKVHEEDVDVARKIVDDFRTSEYLRKV